MSPKFLHVVLYVFKNISEHILYKILHFKKLKNNYGSLSSQENPKWTKKKLQK